MNYVTSCPECGTQFLLSTEHLKAHRGKVQCGHCQHVFNAKNRLTPVTEEETPAAPTETEVTEPAIATAVAAETPVEINPERYQEKEVNLPYIGDLPPKTTEAKPSPIEIEDLTTSPNFKPTKAKSHWGLQLTACLLVIAAGLQAVYYLRTQIAAEYPQVKPLLVQACSQLACTIDLPKNLDLLLIDDSDMQQDETYEAVINFTSTLINHAHYAQAYPNIELTLTNVDDQPLIRTVLKPNQYLKQGTSVENGIPAREELKIKLALSASGEPVSGYRVQLVY